MRVAVRSGDNWTCEATPESHLAAEDRESFGYLMQLDPHFTLRFDDASALLVNVAETGVGAGCYRFTRFRTARTARPRRTGSVRRESISM